MITEKYLSVDLSFRRTEKRLGTQREKPWFPCEHEPVWRVAIASVPSPVTVNVGVSARNLGRGTRGGGVLGDGG